MPRRVRRRRPLAGNRPAIARYQTGRPLELHLHDYIHEHPSGPVHRPCVPRAPPRRHLAARGARRRPRPPRRRPARRPAPPAAGRRPRLLPRRPRPPAPGPRHDAASARPTKVRREEETLDATGIRTLRRQPVYTSPNVFPPPEFEQREVADDPDFREPVEPQHCYVCKQKYTDDPPLLRPALPAVRGVQLRQAHRDWPTCAGRVALLTGGRVKIGYQAGLKLLRAGARLIVTTRFPRDSAARYAREPDFGDWGDRLEIFGLDLRHTPSVEAFCRRAAGDPRPARLHHQQRLPDRAPPAGVLRAHDGRRDARRSTACPSTCASCSALRGLARRAPASRRQAGHGRDARRLRAPPAEHRRPGPPGRAVAGAAAAGGAPAATASVPRGPARSGPAAGRSARAQLVAAAAGRGAVGGAARGAARQRGRAVHPQRAAQAADAPHARARQAHRQRVGGGRAVLPQLQDDAASAHQHGQGRAQHDDAHGGGRLPRRTAST